MSKEQFVQTILTIIVLAVIFVVLSALGWITIEQKQRTDITSFEECAQYYPVMESYPRQCNTPSGNHFVEQVGNNNGGGEICAQVITSAYNPTTQETKEFSTPCDVPKEWIILNQASLTCPPTSEEFASTQEYTGPIAEVDFSTYPEAKTFTTKIKGAVTEGVNFAGHYVVASWGCGTSCQGHAVIDVTNGAIVTYGLTSEYGASSTKDSPLLTLNPKENIPPLDAYEGIIPTTYYLMVNDTLTQICQ